MTNIYAILSTGSVWNNDMHNMIYLSKISFITQDKVCKHMADIIKSLAIRYGN